MINIMMMIQLALDTIASLDPLQYGNLTWYREHTTVFRHLQGMLELFQSKENPVVTLNGKAYFLFAMEYLKTNAGCGGTIKAWQSHKIFLTDLGLIETYVVNVPSSNPTINRIWETAQRKKQRCETLWTVPLYTPELLQHADEIAGLYRSAGISVSNIRKTVIVRFRGQDRANWLYWPNCRVIGDNEQMLLRYCNEAIQDGIASKGYTTFREVRERMIGFLIGRLLFRSSQEALADYEEIKREKALTRILDKILENKRFLCVENGCEYRQIRRSDREQYDIPLHLHCWIIVPAE